MVNIVWFLSLNLLKVSKKCLGGDLNTDHIFKEQYKTVRKYHELMLALNCSQKYTAFTARAHAPASIRSIQEFSPGIAVETF